MTHFSKITFTKDGRLVSFYFGGYEVEGSALVLCVKKDVPIIQYLIEHRIDFLTKVKGDVSVVVTNVPLENIKCIHF